MRSNYTRPVDSLALAGVFFLIAMLFVLLTEPSTSLGMAAGNGYSSPTPSLPDWDEVAAPYDHYVVTQGLHGYSYGHAAIDLSAGKGAVIKSPIHGTVADHYIDEWGNPTLVIENKRYRVLLLHGIYSVSVGQFVSLGDPVGVESNQGYTVDYAGRSCAGRDCGYHTHLNIFDLALGENVNPLDLISGK
jgi:murein DD-endopeptidase MepM/ murein hydrolase activator NlpD